METTAELVEQYTRYAREAQCGSTEKRRYYARAACGVYKLLVAREIAGGDPAPALGMPHFLVYPA